MSEMDDDFDRCYANALQVAKAVIKEFQDREIPFNVAGVAIAHVMVTIGISAGNTPEVFDQLLDATRVTFKESYEHIKAQEQSGSV